jgi:hypothetical protein
VHGALAFYLGNQQEIDAYLVEGQRTAEEQHRTSRGTNAELIAKLQRARKRESDSRLTPIWTAASFADCVASRLKSIYALLPRLVWQG